VIILEGNVVPLNRRRSLILKAVVEEHVRSGQPVGSSQIVRHYGLQVSPATVRNELSRLEDDGYVMQPHTSAGRTPSDLGYRFYVDNLLPAPLPLESEQELIRRYLASCGHDVRNAVRSTARFLADLTSYIAVVLAPAVEPTKIRQLHMMPLAADQALLVVILDGGAVQHRVLDLPGGLDRSDLERLAREMQQVLVGCTADDLPPAMGRLWRSSLARYGEALESATIAVAEVMQAGPQSDERLFLGGTANILSLPEFQDVEKLRLLLRLLESEATVFELLEHHSPGAGVRVTIGTENAASEMQSCSLVTAKYRLSGGGTGVIGILGPTRMDYGRVVSLLDLAGYHLDQVFRE
jgi:heat-inducible transcriptional repressor